MSNTTAGIDNGKPSLESGLLTAYIALGIMAVLPIYFGSFASLKFKKRIKTGSKITLEPIDSEDDEEAEFFSLEDAKMFPIFGSATLLSLYLLFTYFDKAYINYVLTAYFAILGVGALVKSSLAIARKATGWEIKGDYKVEMWKKDKEILSYHFGLFHLILLTSSIVIGAYYAMTKQWIVSNLYGEALATSAVQLLNLDSFLTGMALLAGLFFYDIFWVFGTDVMVTVAKSFDAPIKVVFPKDIFHLIKEVTLHGKAGKTEFTMLGLGDIVIPGIFVALCLRFDQYNYEQTLAGKKNPKSTSFPKPYFTACFIAYAIGLITTGSVMHIFQAAQPALLYLSPACILSVLLTALIRGEIKPLFAYAPDESKKKKAEIEDAKSSQENTSSKDVNDVNAINQTASIGSKRATKSTPSIRSKRETDTSTVDDVEDVDEVAPVRRTRRSRKTKTLE
jgi:minor histocompatibility antigen H13